MIILDIRIRAYHQHHIMGVTINKQFSKIQPDIAKDPSYRDLTFICGDQALSYHQGILIPLSPMLESIVQGELCHPSLPINNVTITLDNVNMESVRVLMELVYTGQSKACFSEACSGVQKLASMLGFEDLQIDIQEDIHEKGVDDKRPGAAAPKRSRSRAWDFFSLLEDNSAICSLCQKVVRRTVGSGNTHGMLRHLRSNHADVFNEDKKEDVMDDILEETDAIQSVNVKEYQLKTSDLKEFASKLESLTAKKSERKASKPPPAELYPKDHYIWTYYTERPDSKANCVTCERDISRSFSGKNDFMVNHMSHFHPEVYTQYITKKARLDTNQQSENKTSGKSMKFLASTPPRPSDVSQIQSPDLSPLKSERKRKISDEATKGKTKEGKKKKIVPKDTNEEETKMEEVFLQHLKTDIDELGEELRFQSGKKKTSVIWNFFSEADSENTKDVNAKCNLCCAEIPRPHGTTSKMSGHLRKHKLLFQEFKRLDKLRSLQSPPNDEVLIEQDLNDSDISVTIE